MWRYYATSGHKAKESIRCERYMHDSGKFHVQILTEQDGNGAYILVQSGKYNIPVGRVTTANTSSQ